MNMLFVSIGLHKESGHKNDGNFVEAMDFFVRLKSPDLLKRVISNLIWGLWLINHNWNPVIWLIINHSYWLIMDNYSYYRNPITMVYKCL